MLLDIYYKSSRGGHNRQNLILKMVRGFRVCRESIILPISIHLPSGDALITLSYKAMTPLMWRYRIL